MPKRLPFEIKIIKYLRYRDEGGFLGLIYRVKLHFLRRKGLIQIANLKNVAGGLVLGHNGTIVINSHAKIGSCVTISNGVTIGMDFRGKRKGTPVIGNHVAISANSVIVGNIRIGNDVFVAPCTFVNFDVPYHSIVVGNPAKIIHCDWATEGFIPNIKF